MTRRSNARLAGIMFLLYFVAGITSLVLSKKTTGGAEGTAAKLASMAQQAGLMRTTALLELFIFFIAVALAVSLYALTRDQDRDIALLALCCRVTEGVMAAIGASARLDLLSVATASTSAAGADAAAAQALGALLMNQGGGTATIFAVGSTLYAYLFLRARSIPVPLAWLGLISSALMVVVLPLQLAGFLRGGGWGSLATWVTWMPLAVFEVTLALWLIFKGVAVRPAPQSTPMHAGALVNP